MKRVVEREMSEKCTGAQPLARGKSGDRTLPDLVPERDAVIREREVDNDNCA